MKTRKSVTKPTVKYGHIRHRIRNSLYTQRVMVVISFERAWALPEFPIT